MNYELTDVSTKPHDTWFMYMLQMRGMVDISVLNTT